MTADSALDNATAAREMLRAGREGPPLVACTTISAPDDGPVSVGSKLLVYPDGRTRGRLDGGPLDAAVVEAARKAIPRHAVETLAFAADGRRLAGRRAVETESAVVEVLLEVVEPQPVLLVVGGGHVGRAMGQFGALLGMSVVVLDDREEYAAPERFPFADRVICGDVDEELDRFPVTGNTFVVLVSRGHKQDEISLRHVVQWGAAYVGMIGSKRRTRTVLEHLRRDGFDAEALSRVFTPIGLDIGAETPEEIALAVLAEIVLVRRGGAARPLSDHGLRLVQEAPR